MRTIICTVTIIIILHFPSPKNVHVYEKSLVHTSRSVPFQRASISDRLPTSIIIVLCNLIWKHIFKPGRRAPGFLKLILCGSSVCVFVCVCVCPRPRLLITSGMIWSDMNLIRLVKQVLQLLYGNYSRCR